ncbi:hypothetical protein AAY473_032985 [Plecturocebus cupreus]
MSKPPAIVGHLIHTSGSFYGLLSSLCFVYLLITAPPFLWGAASLPLHGPEELSCGAYSLPLPPPLQRWACVRLRVAILSPCGGSRCVGKRQADTSGDETWARMEPWRPWVLSSSPVGACFPPSAL